MRKYERRAASAFLLHNFFKAFIKSDGTHDANIRELAQDIVIFAAHIDDLEASQ